MICRCFQVMFITPSNLTHNLFFYFRFFWYKYFITCINQIKVFVYLSKMWKGSHNLDAKTFSCSSWLGETQSDRKNVLCRCGAFLLHACIFILAGCHVRANAGDLAVHGALIACVCVRVCAAACACVTGLKFLSHHATNRDQVCFCRQVSIR